jgi:hypothetical protein
LTGATHGVKTITAEHAEDAEMFKGLGELRELGG